MVCLCVCTSHCRIWGEQKRTFEPKMVPVTAAQESHSRLLLVERDTDRATWSWHRPADMDVNLCQNAPTGCTAQIICKNVRSWHFRSQSQADPDTVSVSSHNHKLSTTLLPSAPAPPPQLRRCGSVLSLKAHLETCTEPRLLPSRDKGSGNQESGLDTDRLSPWASRHTPRHGALLIPAGRLESSAILPSFASRICLDIGRPDHVCEREGDPDKRQRQPAALFLFCRGGLVLHASHPEALRIPIKQYYSVSPEIHY